MSKALLTYHKEYRNAKSYLRTLRNREKAVDKLSSSGVPLNEAYELVDYIITKNVASGIKNGVLYSMGAALIIAVFSGIFLITGRLYFIILPLAAIALFKGLRDLLTTNKFDG